MSGRTRVPVPEKTIFGILSYRSAIMEYVPFPPYSTVPLLAQLKKVVKTPAGKDPLSR